MCNYRHPGPRRAWEVGSEPPFLHHFDHFRHCVRSGSEFPEAMFCAQARYLSNIDLENGLQIEPEAHREPKGGSTATTWHPNDGRGVGQRLPKGPERAKGSPKSIQKRPKRAQQAQLYKQTPDQPPKWPLCYIIWPHLRPYRVLYRAV